MLPGHLSSRQAKSGNPARTAYGAHGFVSVFLSLVNPSRYTSVANRNVRFSFLKSGFDVAHEVVRERPPRIVAQKPTKHRKAARWDGVE
jgi:hypothetical protein